MLLDYSTDSIFLNQRCEIVKPFKKDLPFVNVRLVDNGAFYHTSHENFYLLRKIFCHLPIQGIEATLFGTINQSKSNTQLTMNVNHKFPFIFSVRWNKVKESSFWSRRMPKILRTSRRETFLRFRSEFGGESASDGEPQTYPS